jgi:hypothetical protein
VLSDLPAIHQWVSAIQRSYCPAERRGVGALRVCELRQMTIRETILEWDEGRSFKYEGVGAPMMKRASNRWSVTAHGERQTLVTSEAEVELKGGVFGVFLQPLVRLMSARMGARSLASLKYLVEHGEPYAGDPRALAFGPVAC